MFKTIDIKKKNQLTKNFELYCETVEDVCPEIIQNDKDYIVPCTIMYNNLDADVKFEIFEAELRLTKEVFGIYKLKESGILINYSEGMRYFFLELLIKQGPIWAKLLKRNRVCVETSLKHCTEHFIDNKYDIRTISIENFIAVKGVR